LHTHTVRIIIQCVETVFITKQNKEQEREREKEANELHDFLKSDDKERQMRLCSCL